MGSSNSRTFKIRNGKMKNKIMLNENEIMSIVNKTGYKRKEVIKYHRKFMKICPNGEFLRENFISYFCAQNPNKDIKILCSQIWNGFDIDKNGKVNFEEFLVAIKMASSNDPREKMRFAFKMYDKNHDSKIDRKEIEYIIMGINEFTGHKAANDSNEPKFVSENMLARYDKDANGYLTQDEFIDELAHSFQTDEALKSFSILKKGFLD